MDEPLRIVEQLVPIGSDGVNEFLRKWLLRSITILRSRSIKDYRASFFLFWCVSWLKKTQSTT